MRPVEGVLIVMVILLLFVHLNLQQVCCLLLVERTMGREVFDGFNSSHDQRKKSTLKKNSLITRCLASSPVW